MKKLGIIANYRKARAAEVLAQIWKKAGELGLELYADECTAELMEGTRPVSFPRMFDKVDAVLALGGDGTMLSAVRELDGRDKPVIGFNIGALGFMTSVAEDEFDRALECLAKDDYIVSRRTMLDASVTRGEEKGAANYHALNDVVVHSGQSSRVVTLDVAINGEPVASYMCDGLIVATPTGSTGHSLSAGGPILPPETPSFVISLICPHTLSSRPLVVPDDSEIDIDIVESGGEVLLAVDGQVGHALGQGDKIMAVRSERSVSLINLPGHSYYDVLRQKLGWRGKNI